MLRPPLSEHFSDLFCSLPPRGVHPLCPLLPSRIDNLMSFIFGHSFDNRLLTVCPLPLYKVGRFRTFCVSKNLPDCFGNREPYAWRGQLLSWLVEACVVVRCVFKFAECVGWGRDDGIMGYGYFLTCARYSRGREASGAWNLFL